MVFFSSGLLTNDWAVGQERYPDRRIRKETSRWNESRRSRKHAAPAAAFTLLFTSNSDDFVRLLSWCHAAWPSLARAGSASNAIRDGNAAGNASLHCLTGLIHLFCGALFRVATFDCSVKPQPIKIMRTDRTDIQKRSRGEAARTSGREFSLPESKDSYDGNAANIMKYE